MNACPLCGHDSSNARDIVSEEHLAGIIQGRGVVLGRVEASVLSTLLKHAPNFVSTERLIIAAYGDEEPEWADGTIKVFIHRLRHKLGSAALIESRWGVGYRLVAQ